MFNLDGRIGGDAALSPRGEEYALRLPELVRESVGVSQKVLVTYAKPGLNHPPVLVLRAVRCMNTQLTRPCRATGP
jgi:hypothetical protein